MLQLFKLCFGYFFMAIGVFLTIVFSVPLLIISLCIFAILAALGCIPLAIFMIGMHLSENV